MIVPRPESVMEAMAGAPKRSGQNLDFILLLILILIVILILSLSDRRSSLDMASRAWRGSHLEMPRADATFRDTLKAAMRLNQD